MNNDIECLSNYLANYQINTYLMVILVLWKMYQSQNIYFKFKVIVHGCTYKVRTTFVTVTVLNFIIISLKLISSL